MALYCCVMSLISMYLCKNDYLEFFSKGNKENKNQETKEDELPKENKKKKTKGHETPTENKPVKENKKPKEPKIPNTVNVTKKTLDDFKNFLYMYNILIDFKTNNVNINVTKIKDIIKSIDKNMKTMKDVYDVYDKYLKDSSNSLIKTNLNKVHSTLYKTNKSMKSIIEKINKFKMSNAQLIITKPPPSPPTVVPFVSTLTAPTPAPSSLVGATAVSSDSVPPPLPVTVVPPVTVPTQAPSSLIGVTAVPTDRLSPLSVTVVPPSSDVTVAPINVMAPVTVVPPESLGPIVTSVTVPTQAPSSLIRLTSSTDSLSSPLPPTEPSTVTLFPTSLSPSNV